MRKQFAELVRQRMKKDDRIWVLTGDLGFGVWDSVRDEFPDRYVNCGASEQAMSDIAVGLALSGKIPIVYSITPFLIYRAFETIRTYIKHENPFVILAGAGRDTDYAHDGWSHHATDVEPILSALGLLQYYPNSDETLKGSLDMIFEEKLPCFLSLRRN